MSIPLHVQTFFLLALSLKTLSLCIGLVLYALLVYAKFSIAKTVKETRLEKLRDTLYFISYLWVASVFPHGLYICWQAIVIKSADPFLESEWLHICLGGLSLAVISAGAYGIRLYLVWNNIPIDLSRAVGEILTKMLRKN
jgi:hypothetical protein